MTPQTDDQKLRLAHERAQQLLEQMTLREKIGQMTQVEKNSITPDEVREHAIGSVLSGGGGNPEPNSPQAWRDMVTSFVEASRTSRLGIPILYGVDAVHGHNNVKDATIFPHNIGLGATGNEDLVERIARATATEVSATGAQWNFAPAVSIPLDIRWGRTYEGYGQDTGLVARLASSYVKGLRGSDWAAPEAVLPSVKHFIGDGAARYGTSVRLQRLAQGDDRTMANAGVDDDMQKYLDAGAWTIDQGDAEGTDAWLREVALPPYRRAIEAGALNVMASYSTWNGTRMHANRELLQGLLKDELGFQGFVVSDWEAMEMLNPDYPTAIATSIEAGVDMSMVPFDYVRFIDTVELLVEDGRLSLERIDDAVRRILAVKIRMGLLDEPYDLPYISVVGSASHRSLAREAVAASQVLLKNKGDLLPLKKASLSILVAGEAAADVGLGCGGWTISWMGSRGSITRGSTILDGVRRHAQDCEIHHEPSGDGSVMADVGIVVVHEEPYAEGMGDRHELALPSDQVALVQRIRKRVDSLVVVLISGRPVVLGEVAEWADAIIAGWLPGSEADGVADPLFGATRYQAKLRYLWPVDQEHYPLHPFGEAQGVDQVVGAAWPIGFGLETEALD